VRGCLGEEAEATLIFKGATNSLVNCVCNGSRGMYDMEILATCKLDCHPLIELLRIRRHTGLPNNSGVAFVLIQIGRDILPQLFEDKCTSREV
jgi:hypothetical protein